jgi:hypothetical protein
MALHVKSDGTDAEVRPKNGKAFTLEELQSLVGGYIEPLHTGPPLNMALVVNEEGKIRNLPLNANATAVFQGIMYPGTEDFIVGDAVILTEEEMGG